MTTPVGQEEVPTVVTPIVERAAPRPVTQTPPPLSAEGEPSRSIGKFRVLCPLGAGGMARVFLCQARGLGGFEKLVVLKIPHEGFTTESDVREMFLHEARIAGRLNHPNIVQTNEVGIAGDLPYIAMEYLEGQALASIQKEVGLSGLSTRLQLRIISQALAGAHHAHELRRPDGTSYGLVHRDISPQNVFVTYDGVVKILDFGIAKVSSAELDQTHAGIFKGKLTYIAPEQAAGLRVDRRADLFAFGVMIWEAIAHRRLVIRGRGEFDVLRARIAGEEPRIDVVVPDVDPELARICGKAMACGVDDRYGNALELKDALDAYLAGSAAEPEDDIGSFVRRLFADQRVAVRARVDAELQRADVPAEPGAPAPALPVDDAAGVSLTVSGSRVGLARIFGSTARRAGAALLVATAAASALLLTQRMEPRRAAPGAPAPDTAATTTALPPAAPGRPAAAVHVELRAHPSSARILLDGVPVPGDVFVHEGEPSAEAHTMTISAPGYVTAQRTIVFDRDRSVDLTLEPARAAPARPAATSRRRPLGAIDESDPYR